MQKIAIRLLLQRIHHGTSWLGSHFWKLPEDPSDRAKYHWFPFVPLSFFNFQKITSMKIQFSNGLFLKQVCFSTVMYIHILLLFGTQTQQHCLTSSWQSIWFCFQGSCTHIETNWAAFVPGTNCMLSFWISVLHSAWSVSTESCWAFFLGSILT